MNYGRSQEFGPQFNNKLAPTHVTKTVNKTDSLKCEETTLLKKCPPIIKLCFNNTIIHDDDFHCFIEKKIHT